MISYVRRMLGRSGLADSAGSQPGDNSAGSRSSSFSFASFDSLDASSAPRSATSSRTSAASVDFPRSGRSLGAPSLLLQAAAQHDAACVRRMGTHAQVDTRFPLTHAPVELGATALLGAVLGNHAATLKAVLALGPDLDARHDVIGYTALMHAVSRGYVEAVRLLMEAGADPHVEGFDGVTAVHLAQDAAEDHADGARILKMLSGGPQDA